MCVCAGAVYFITKGQFTKMRAGSRETTKGKHECLELGAVELLLPLCPKGQEEGEVTGNLKEGESWGAGPREGGPCYSVGEHSQRYETTCRS